ncbi:hypothetical protein J9B83_13695 [Marinomonas sp. A79]|uniref:GspL cytoplasmic actin-ATPase-like region n=1 Tax=Marinomonas vulgaris TaxID=2823372 RepID=A0ABS5HEL8_9GAMM|nr:hypothetical protein [Marinomonas vulgaris]MBR7889967.1 hypothetical protein [Marinomonas vulgaris]
MKRTPNYFVAVYSAQGCEICSPDNAIAHLSHETDEAPDDQQLLTIQASINAAAKSRLVILLPDAWLSVTEHQIDHQVPPKLLPLAALSYAAEATFTPPESVMLNYQQSSLPSKQTGLTVFACSVAWAEQLRRPFQTKVDTCLLVPESQWHDDTVPVRRRTWRYCQKKSLFVYQPDQDRRRQGRRLWWCLLVLSLILNTAAGLYFLSLKHTTEAAQVAQQATLNSQPEWFHSTQKEGFVDAILALMQALPRSVRVLSLVGEEERAELRLLLPASNLEPLLSNWRQQQPNWQWQWVEHGSVAISPTQPVEVVNVSITILASE